MNEVEKMYENAGIEPRCNIYPTFYDCSTYPHEKCEDCVEWEYPPFTAEKQIRIMELLVRKGMLLFTFSTQGNYKVSGFCRGSNYCSDINEAFANYINNLWQDLTEEERKQIKNILE